MAFGPWNAEVDVGDTDRWFQPTGENPRPVGRALVAELGENEFLVTGYYCRVDFRPAGSEQQRTRARRSRHRRDPVRNDRRHVAAPAVPAGRTGDLGERRIPASSNLAGRGGETNGLYFGEEPVVLRASLATY